MSYRTLAELQSQVNQSGKTMPQLVQDAECEQTETDCTTLRKELWARYETMRRCAQSALENPKQMVGNLIRGQAKRQHDFATTTAGYCGTFLNKTMAMAFSGSEVNASMGRICAAPTAGSCGILPAVLVGIEESRGCSQDQIIDALLVAGGIGAVITCNATVSGAEGGCQAECGAAAAMAAGAAVYLAGGSVDKIFSAAALALIHVMGLVCDPVAGLVQLPCSFRNASGAINALLSADMALAGQGCAIPVDEVIASMFETGKSLPVELRETAQGGLAATPTAQKMMKTLYHRKKEPGCSDCDKKQFSSPDPTQASESCAIAST